ncbi:family 16 glycosylhydrolase [Pseudoroseicyclus aestuarii]|uniref:Beta-glucanase n=1 Tax=Pseudoroseicyclus aestuarii TaxID=1795041 RepID=A0A318SP85_9RHOB|nr:family 16 glycosylhydrolase [Pseudoroseicyclus aestuarii]PYE83691.1 glycosyl hydrolase family 16 [Pseudoroseicyclus aestuarii]
MKPLGIIAALAALPFAIPSAAAASEAFETSFESMHMRGWSVSNYDFNSTTFATDWRSWQVSIDDGLTLSLDPHPRCPNAYAGASIKRDEPTHYGRYEARFQAARGEGVITGFFTYTGESYGTRHDEIDIEILGRDTTQLNIAWFVDGALTDHRIDLGFDASEGMHDYAFEWREDRIDWFVDGRRVFTARAEDGPLPAVPGRVFANVWAADPSISRWSGEIGHNVQTEARIERLGYRPLNEAPRERWMRLAHAPVPVMTRIPD